MKNTKNHLIKPNIPIMFNFSAVAALLLILFLVNSGCQKNASAPSSTSDQTAAELKLSQTNDWTEVNLVSDVDEYDPVFIDPICPFLVFLLLFILNVDFSVLGGMARYGIARGGFI